jgi:peptidoglycan/LPS O-acetylase OafA/YrhL
MFLKKSLEIEQKTTSGVYLQTLTGVRAVAVLWTLLLHMWGITLGGALYIPLPFEAQIGIRTLAESGEWGVRIFFVLSGFLLSLPYLKQNDARTFWQRTKTFYERRAVRILPAYYALLLVLLYLTLFGYSKLPSTSYMLGHVLFINSWWYEPPLRGVFWSLSVEVCFYLVLPFLITALRPGRWPYLFIGAFMVAFLFRVVLRHYAIAGNPQLWELSFSFMGQMEYFIAGMMAAYFFARRQPEGRVGDRFMFVGLLMISIELQLFFRHPERLMAWFQPIHYAFTPLVALAIALFIYGAAAGGRFARALLGNKVMVFIGTISFSLYLWHTVFMDAFAHAGLLDGLMPWNRFAIASLYLLPPILITSMASYWLVEMPFLRIRHQSDEPNSGSWISRHPVQALALAGLVLVLLTAIANLAYGVNHPAR